MKKNTEFIPALKFGWLTKAFDPFLRLTMPERKIKKDLLLQAKIKEDDKILDFGCGTGTLTIMTKEMFEGVTVSGVDVDPKILEIAKEKVNSRMLDIHLDVYDGTILPYKDGTFNKVITSLVFHHLKRYQKVNALQEIYRVLKNDGELHIGDFGKSHNVLMNVVSFIPRLLDGFENTSDNYKGLIPHLIKDAGFINVKENNRVFTVFGSLSYYSAKKPNE